MDRAPLCALLVGILALSAPAQAEPSGDLDPLSVSKDGQLLTATGTGYAEQTPHVVRLFRVASCDSTDAQFVTEGTGTSDADGRITVHFHIDPESNYKVQILEGSPQSPNRASVMSGCSDAAPEFDGPAEVRSFARAHEHSYAYPSGILGAVTLGYDEATESQVTVQRFADPSALPPMPEGFVESAYGFDLDVSPPPQTGAVSFVVPAAQVPEGPVESWRMMHHDDGWEAVPSDFTVQRDGSIAVTMDIGGMTFSPFVLAGQPGFEDAPARGPWLTVGGIAAGLVAAALCAVALVLHFRR